MLCIALEAALTDQIAQGGMPDAHAPPFRKRVPAARAEHAQPGRPYGAQRPQRHTWSALLCAVASMLKAPRASPAGQTMHSLAHDHPAGGKAASAGH